MVACCARRHQQAFSTQPIPSPTDNPIMERDNTTAELRRIEFEIALRAAGDGARLLRVLLQLGTALVVDLTPTVEDEEPLHWWR